MAVLYFRISSDWEQVVKLRDEIKKLENQLKSFGKSTPEAQIRQTEERLASTRQEFMRLATEAAKAGAMMEQSMRAINENMKKSASKIAESVEIIIKAQEQMSRVSGIQPKSIAIEGRNANTYPSQSNASTVQAQTKAYNELADEIDNVMGTRSQNIRRMIEEQNAIRLINEEIKKLTKYQGENSTLSSRQQQRLEQLNASLLQHKAALSELRQSLNNSFKLDNTAATSMNALSQSLSRMRMAYRELTEEERKSPFGKELLASIQQADAKIKQLDATIGSHQRNVGNYASSFNGLGMSVQQIVRELPAATMGLNMFFLAISNNLPILTDEIKRAREENARLTAQNQATIPVWKQLVSSIFSWQTAMMLAITIFSMYGKEIVAWVKKLFNASNSLENLIDIQKEMNNVISKGTKNAQGDVTRLKLLYNATQDVTRSVKERSEAVEELQRKYPDYFGNMSKEDVLAGNAADSYIRLSQAIIASARARAAQDKMTENASKILDNEQKINEAYERLEKAEAHLSKEQDLLEGLHGNPEASAFQAGIVRSAKSNVDSIVEEIAGYRRTIFETNKLQQELYKSIDIESLLFNPFETDSDEQKDSINRLEIYLNDLIKLRQDNENRQIEIMHEGTEKGIAEIKQRYSRIRDEVRTLESNLIKAQGGELTKEQIITFSTAYSTIDTRENQDIEKVKTDAMQEQMQAERDEMQRMLQEIGTYQQKRLAIEEEYRQKRSKLYNTDENGNKALREGFTEGNVQELDRKEQEAYSSIDEQFAQREATYRAWCEQIGNYTIEHLKETLEKAEEELAKLEESGNASDSDLSTARAKVTKTKKAIEDAEAKEDLSPGKRSVEGWKDLYDVLKECENEFKDIGDAIGGTSGEIISTVGTVLSTTTGIVNGIVQLVQVSTTTITGVSAAAATAIRTVETASVILTIVSLALQLVMTIVNLFNSDAKHEKNIEKLQERIDALSDSYERLGKVVEDNFSKTSSKGIMEQNELLEKQKALIEQQIKEEEKKKKTDNDRIKEWRDDIQEINDTIEENKEKAVDAIFGNDIQSAIEDFTDAYTDAWSGVESRAGAARDSVKQMMRDMVTESIKDMIKSSGSMDQIRKKLQEFYADNVLTGWEQQYIYNMAENVQKQIDEQFAWADDLFKESQDESGSSRAFGTEMTQDQGAEISGRLTQVAESNYRIELANQQQTLAITELKGSISSISNTLDKSYNLGDEVRTILAQSYMELRGINENTAAIVRPIQMMQRDISEIKSNTKGL